MHTFLSLCFINEMAFFIMMKYSSLSLETFLALMSILSDNIATLALLLLVFSWSIIFHSCSLFVSLSLSSVSVGQCIFGAGSFHIL